MRDTVRIHLVADIHHGPDVAVKKGESALRILDGFVRRTNELRPDLVVDLGDRISDIDRETDFGRERDVARIFSGLPTIARPKKLITASFSCGNHSPSMVLTGARCTRLCPRINARMR